MCSRKMEPHGLTPVVSFFTRLRVLGYSKKISFGGLSAYASGVTSAEANGRIHPRVNTRGLLRRRIKLIFALFFIVSILSSACALREKDITITDAKIVTTVDENLMPVKITDTFAKDTTKVSCWIKWRDSKINSQLLAKWHYVTDDIHILDYLFTIPKKEGMGSITLSMPEGKKLPPGLYRVGLFSGNRVLKSLQFKVE